MNEPNRFPSAPGPVAVLPRAEYYVDRNIDVDHALPRPIELSPDYPSSFPPFPLNYYHWIKSPNLKSNARRETRVGFDEGRKAPVWVRDRSIPNNVPLPEVRPAERGPIGRKKSEIEVVSKFDLPSFQPPILTPSRGPNLPSNRNSPTTPFLRRDNDVSDPSFNPSFSSLEKRPISRRQPNPFFDPEPNDDEVRRLESALEAKQKELQDLRSKMNKVREERISRDSQISRGPLNFERENILPSIQDQLRRQKENYENLSSEYRSQVTQKKESSTEISNLLELLENKISNLEAKMHSPTPKPLARPPSTSPPRQSTLTPLINRREARGNYSPSRTIYLVSEGLTKDGPASGSQRLSRNLGGSTSVPIDSLRSVASSRSGNPRAIASHTYSIDEDEDRRFQTPRFESHGRSESGVKYLSPTSKRAKDISEANILLPGKDSAMWSSKNERVSTTRPFASPPISAVGALASLNQQFEQNFAKKPPICSTSHQPRSSSVSILPQKIVEKPSDDYPFTFRAAAGQPAPPPKEPESFQNSSLLFQTVRKSNDPGEERERDSLRGVFRGSYAFRGEGEGKLDLEKRPTMVDSILS